MAFDEGGTTTRRRRRRRRRAARASRPVVRRRNQGADTAEAARFAREEPYARERARDSAEAARFAREEGYARVRRNQGSARREAQELELIALYQALSEPDAPRFLEALAKSDNPAVKRTVETLGPSTEDLFEILESRPARLTHNLAKDVEEAAVGFPGGVKETGSAVGFDVRDVATGRDHTPSRTKKVGKEIVESYRHTYGPLVRGDFETSGSGCSSIRSGRSSTPRRSRPAEPRRQPAPA